MLIQDFYVEISKQPSAGVACTSIEKKLWHRWFPVGFTKILITSFLYNTSGRLFQDRQLANRFRRMCGSLYSREYWEVFFFENTSCKCSIIKSTSISSARSRVDRLHGWASWNCSYSLFRKYFVNQNCGWVQW